MRFGLSFGCGHMSFPSGNGQKQLYTGLVSMVICVSSCMGEGIVKPNIYTLYLATRPLTQLLCFGEGLKLFFCRRLAISSINLRSCSLTRELFESRPSKRVLSFCTW